MSPDVDPLISPKFLRSRLVLEWQEKERRVFSAGPYTVIKLWDIEKELPGQDIDTSLDSPLICMVCDHFRSDENRTQFMGIQTFSVRDF